MATSRSEPSTLRPKGVAPDAPPGPHSPSFLHTSSTPTGPEPCHALRMDAFRVSVLADAELPRRPFSVAARARSVVYALRGIQTVVASQHNAWIHALATCIVVVAGVAFDLGRFEWLALVFAIVSVWAAEALNTAFEFLCDVASPDFHPLVARAKDVAASAVLICAAGAVVIAAFVFVPHF